MRKFSQDEIRIFTDKLDFSKIRGKLICVIIQDPQL